MRRTGLAGSVVGQTRHSLTRWTVWGRARSLLVARVAEGAGLAFPGLRDTPPFPVSPWLSHSRLPNVWRPHAGGEPAWHGPLPCSNTCMQNTPKRRRGWQRMGQFDSIVDSMDLNLSKLQETVKGRGAWHDAVHAAKTQTRLSD